MIYISAAISWNIRNNNSFLCFLQEPPPPLTKQTQKKIHDNKLKPTTYSCCMPTISAGCLSILQLFVLSTTDIIINIAHEYILHISLQKKTMWCSLLFLSQDKKMNRQSTDFPLLSTVYKMYTYMHVLTFVSSYNTWHCTTLFQYSLWSE